MLCNKLTLDDEYYFILENTPATVMVTDYTTADIENQIENGRL